MNLEKTYLQENTLDLLLHTYSPEIKVGDRLFVKEQTADRTCWEKTKREVEADSVDEPGDACLVGETGV